MGQFEDLTGREFGRWRVLERGPNYGTGTTWVCECQCEKKTVRTVQASNLRSGGSTGCDCVRIEKVRERVRKHGRTGTPEYYVWQQMKYRCTNEKNAAYADYGGRGIRVCDRWMESFEAFIEDMGNRPTKTSTIERRDVNGNYCPENCCWIEKKEQNKNKRNTAFVEVEGEKVRLQEVADEHGISNGALTYRVEQGMSVDDAVAQPVQKRHYTREYKGEQKSLVQLSAIAGVPPPTIQHRIVYYGWSVEKAAETPVDTKLQKGKKLLFRGEDRSVKEIAKILGIKEKLFRWRLWKTRGDIEKAAAMGQ